MESVTVKEPYSARRKQRYESDPVYREQVRERNRRHYEKKRAERLAKIESGDIAPKQVGRPPRDRPGESLLG